MGASESLKLFDLVSGAILSGKAEFFYDNRLRKKCCLIGEAVIIFKEEEEGSFSMQYQNIFPMWIRETAGWEQLRDALAKVHEDEDVECGHIRRRVYAIFIERLAAAVGGAEAKEAK